MFLPFILAIREGPTGPASPFLVGPYVILSAFLSTAARTLAQEIRERERELLLGSPTRARDASWYRIADLIRNDLLDEPLRIQVFHVTSRISYNSFRKEAIIT